jgi:transcriptional regulator with XRE-family HTH domain
VLAPSLQRPEACDSLIFGFQAVANTTRERSLRVRELGRFIRDQRGAARLSLRKLSKLAGISNPYLSQIERGLRRPSAEILQAIAKALRISAETLYVKAGILEERTDNVDLEVTIRRDGTLLPKQKQILLDLYQGFRREKGPQARRRPVRKVAAAKRSAPARKTAARKTAARKTTARKSSAKRAARRTR